MNCAANSLMSFYIVNAGSAVGAVDAVKF